MEFKTGWFNWQQMFHQQMVLEKMKKDGSLAKAELMHQQKLKEWSKQREDEDDNL